jgi:hypothetical protein
VEEQERDEGGKVEQGWAVHESEILVDAAAEEELGWASDKEDMTDDVEEEDEAESDRECTGPPGLSASINWPPPGPNLTFFRSSCW